MFPLSTVLFPGASMPLHVFEPRYRALMRDCLAGDHRFGVILIERGSEVGGGDVRAALGTRGLITKAIELPDGRWLLQVVGESVVEVQEWLPDDPYPVALVRDHWPESIERSPLSPLSPPSPPSSPTDVGDDEAGVLLAAATQRVRRARALLAEQGARHPCTPTSRSTATAIPTRLRGSSAQPLLSTPTTHSASSAQRARRPERDSSLS